MTRLTFVEWVCALLIAACAMLLVVGVAGCAQTFQGLCAVQPAGMTDSGLPVIAVVCEPQ